MEVKVYPSGDLKLNVPDEGVVNVSELALTLMIVTVEPERMV